jgi:hypothetical protein
MQKGLISSVLPAMAGGFIAIAGHAYADAQFPPGWPKPRASQGGCVSLSGTYDYYGEAGQRGGRPTFDRGAFNRMSMRGKPESAVVTHSPEAGTVTVAIQGENLAPADRAKFSRTLKCEEGWSVYSVEAKDFGNANIGHVSYARTRIYFTKAEDDSLLVRQSHEMEMKSNSEKRSGEAWYRFPVIADKQSGK